MKLTDEQQWVIEHRLNALVERLGDGVTPQTRSSLIERLRSRVYGHLESLPHPVGESDIDFAVANCLRPGGATPPPRQAVASSPAPTPATPIPVSPRRDTTPKPVSPVVAPAKPKAPPILPSAPTELEDAPWMAPPRPTAFALHVEEARWLGVCAGLAGWLGVYPWIIRLLFLLLGLTGPVGVGLYILMYVQMYFHSPDAPRFDWIVFARRLFGFVGAVFLLYEGSVCVWFASSYLLQRYAALSISSLRPWNWLGGVLNEPMIVVFVLLGPLAILSGTPMVNEWDKTLRRVWQAGLALYGMFLSLGLASLLCGIILHFVKQAATWGR